MSTNLHRRTFLPTITVVCLLLVSCSSHLNQEPPAQPQASSSRTKITESEAQAAKEKEFEQAFLVMIGKLPKSARVLVPDFDVQVITVPRESGRVDLSVDHLAAERIKTGAEQELITQGFTVVDRATLGRARAEIGFGHGGMVDEETNVRLGKMIGATHLLVGKYAVVRMLLSQQFVAKMHVTLRLIHLETMTLLHSISYDDQH